MTRRYPTQPPVSREDLPPGLDRFVLPGEVFEAVIGGGSALDLPRLDVSDAESAARFLHRYGYDLRESAHRAAVERVRHEALGFMRGVLLHGLPLGLPPEYDTLDIMELLLRAGRTPADATREQRLEQAWACSVLRVMHATAHADNYFQHNYYRQIRESILERFVALVKTLPDGSQVLGGDSVQVPLLRFEVKQQKPLRSVMLKLLHKRENVAADLFDHIGVRIIVRRPVDALLALCVLHEQNAFVYANVKPTRSRNTLVDLDAYVRRAEQLIGQWEAGLIEEDAAVAMLTAFDTRPPEPINPTHHNEHSSTRYRSIQFTCRQMIRFTNPLHQRLTRARKVARRHLDGDALREVLEATSLIGVEQDIQFFFPYEVQIMDLAAHREAMDGRAAYSEYKHRQIETVRARVMGRVLALADIELPDLRVRKPVAPQPVGGLRNRV